MRRSVLHARHLRTAPNSGEPPAAGTGGGAPAAPQVIPPGVPAAPAVTPPAPPEPGSGLPDNVDELKAEIVRLRAENGSARVDAKAAAAEEARKQTLAEVAKVLGLTSAEDDPAKVLEAAQAERDTAKQAALETQRELAVFKATGNKADPAKLLDSRSFLAAIKDIDPADTAAIGKAIDDAVTANPSFKSTAQAVGKSSADFAGGPGKDAQTKPMSIQDAVNKSLGV